MAGRSLKVTVSLNDESSLNILAAYAPSGDDRANADFWTDLGAHFTNTGGTINVLLGDMNVVENCYDREPPRVDRQYVVDALHAFTHSLDLRDGWRITNPGSPGYAFRTQKRTGEINLRSRMDRIHVKDALLNRCDEGTMSESGIGSDHHWHLVSVLLTPSGVPLIGRGRSTVPFIILDHAEMRRAISAKAAEAERRMGECRDHPHRTHDKNPRTIRRWFKREILTVRKL